MISRFLEIVSLRFWSSRDRSIYGALGISTIVHSLVFVVASIFIITQIQSTMSQGIDSRLDDSIALKNELTEIEIPELKQEKADDSSASPKTILPKMSALLSNSFKPPNPILDDNESGETEFDQMSEEIDDLLAALSGGAHAGNGKAKAEKGNEGYREKVHNSFFGSESEGSRFVYVVDCSGSMGSPHRSEWRTRFRRLRYELLKSINSLTETQEFYIVFFNHRPRYMAGNRMVVASAENKTKYLDWTRTVYPRGGTDPRRALISALELRPDVIYFLTDGDFHLYVKKDLNKIRQNLAMIHTFCFGNKNSQGVMKMLAKRNGGKFHFVK